MFDPKSNKFPYTEYTDQHYIKVNKNRGEVFDENYKYINDTKSLKFNRFWVRVLLKIIVYPVMHIWFGLKIKGKENLKKHKEEFKNGLITVCNHVHFWDFIGIMKILKGIKPKFLAWDRNINGESGPLLRTIGGIPIPKDNIKGYKKFLETVGEFLQNNGVLHVYPEGSMWEYYLPIRPFKKGAFHFACKYNKPIFPLAYSYRKPGWFRSKILRQIATLTLNIGGPIYKDESLSGVEQEKDLLLRSRDQVCLLAGIEPKDNIYPPIFDNSKRVEY